MKNIISVLVFALLILGTATTVSASESEIPLSSYTNDVPIKMEALSSSDASLISENILGVKEIVGNNIYYDESYIPKLDEAISMNVNGHQVEVFQSGNDILMYFDNIYTYYIDNTTTVTNVEPGISLFTTDWDLKKTINVTNKDWVTVLGYAGTVAGVLVTSPSQIVSVSSVVIMGIAQAAYVGSQYYATTYGTQKVFIDHDCSSTTKRTTYWYSNGAKTKYLLIPNTTKQVIENKISYNGSRSCD